MSCSRGEAKPNSHTKLRLFADSGGYCQNPECNQNLFLTVGEKDFHIAEMAHIISAGKKGPRTDLKISAASKGTFENLILLCPTCHTKIDKAETEYPETLIKKWKTSHSKKINKLFNLKPFKKREDARNAILPLLRENKTIFSIYGPMTDERYNPESEMPNQWLSKILENILPNNRKILTILDMNTELMNSEEIVTLELFRQHVLDFEKRHLDKADINAQQFPEKLEIIFN